MNAILGESFAVLTAILWAGTSTFFTLAGEQVGSRVVNRMRLLLAVPALALIHLVTAGTLVPLDAAPERWGWLGLSAIIGLVIGDGLLFYAFTQIGAQLSMLLMALAPIFSVLMAWLFLGETLSSLKIIAILITLGGSGWVILERNPTQAQAKSPSDVPGHYLRGVLCGIGAAAGQAAGLVLSKQGMSGNFPPLSASLMRVTVAAAGIWLLALLRQQARSSFVALRDRRARRLIAGGVLVGPILGMTLSLAAVQLSDVGIASTLMTLSPVFLLPITHWIFHERIPVRAVMGALVTLAGVAMIFLL